MIARRPLLMIVRLAMKLLWRDWRSGELYVLFASLFIGVATVTGISLFTDRIGQSILDEAGSLLASDAQIVSSQVIPEQWESEAMKLNLRTAHVTEFQAMAFGADNQLQMSSVKAVSENYPLKGTLEVSDDLYGSIEQVTHGPAASTVWVNQRLLSSLSLSVGDVIGVGDADLTVDKVLISEPDNAGSNFGISPRILINNADIELTGALQIGSRVRHRLLLSGDVEFFYETWKSNENETYRWRDVEDANDRVTETLDRAESFLVLSGSLGVILACVGLALASKRYALRQRSSVAILKTVGMTPLHISILYAGSLFAFAFLIVTLGLLTGLVLHRGLIEVFSGLLPRELAPATVKPYVIGAVTGLVSLLAFAFPPIWVLRNTSPARVLREDVSGGTLSQLSTSLIGIVAILFLVYFYSSSVLITSILFFSGIVTVLSVSFLARVLIKLLRRSGSRLGTAWRIGLASLQRHRRSNGIQIVIFSVVLMLLFSLAVLRTRLLDDWQQQLPEGTPNHFAFNIFDDEKLAIEDILRGYEIPVTPFYPMIRGRLVQVNDASIQDILEERKPNGDDFQRELNLTWSRVLAPDNAVIEGDWFDLTDTRDNLVSIESEFARALGIQLGDRLSFSIGGQALYAFVDNIRTVQWDSMSPNFYIIFNSPILNGEGSAYLTSFYLSVDQKSILNEILRQYPTITVIEVDAILDRIQSIVAQVSLAIEFILWLVLLAGFVVLVASIQATLDSRLQESAILRTLGARTQIVRGALAIEFIVLGGLAGLLASLGTQIALYFMQTLMLNMNFQMYWGLILVGPVIGAALISSVGLISTRKVVKVPPLTVLRRI